MRLIMKSVYIISVVLFFFTSCSRHVKNECLFQMNHVEDRKIMLSELIDSVEYVPLETVDSSLLPALSKLLYVRDFIYASADMEIMKFDNKGKFIGKLSEFGNGPQDYLNINDYDIVLRDSEVEIWVCHQKGISRYNAEDFSFLGLISLDIPVLHFKYVSDDAIIIQTSGEHSFCLCDKNGVVRNEFLSNDPANLSHSLMQFIETEDGIFCILANTDEALYYNKQSEGLELIHYVGGIDNVLTRDDNRAYMERYGYLVHPQKVAQDFVNIVTFRKKGNCSMFFLRSGKGEKVLINKNGDDEWESYDIYPNPTIENDLLTGLDVRYLLTMSSCDSDDAFMMSIPAHMLAGALVNGKVIDAEDNPILIKYQLTN